MEAALRLLNIEFPWNEEDLSVATPVLEPPPLVTGQMVEKLTRKMKKGKAPGPSGVVTKMLEVSSDIGSEMIANLTTPSFVITQCQANGTTVLLLVCIKVKVKLWKEGIIEF